MRRWIISSLGDRLMLSDFDDLDKNLAEADKLFINLEAWQGMKDFSFLSDVQRKSLEEFFGKVMDHTELQQRYNTIWKHLGEIYKVFRKSLLDDGLAYEGMLYRDVAERKPSDFRYKHYIFVGFNLLQKVEQRLFLHLKDLGMAEFYWDYDKNILEPQQEAGRYIRQYLTRFPNELSEDRVSPGIDVDEVYNQLSKPKDITYLSAPTEDIQARYVTTWLQQRLATVHAENEHTEPAADSCRAGRRASASECSALSSKRSNQGEYHNGLSPICISGKYFRGCIVGPAGSMA